MNLALVDDHTIFREGLEFVLAQIPDASIVFQAKSGLEFLDKLSEVVPDVVLMDISMPDMNGIEATSKAIKMHPNLKIIALSSHSEEVYYFKMVRAGVVGFVHKNAGKNELIQAIITVYNGGNYFPENLLRNLLIKLGKSKDDSMQIPELSLTRREKEILKLICLGNSNNEIAHILFISPKTVDNHRTNLLSKTQTRNSAHLAMFAVKNHLVDI